MNINQFTGQIPTSFEATGIDESGEPVNGTIKIKLNRLAYKTVTREGFKEAMENADTDPEVIGKLLAGDGEIEPLLAWWEMFEDAENEVMLPITVDNIINLPFDFVTSLAEAVFAKLFPAPTNRENLLAGSARRANMKLAAIPATEAGTPTNSESDTDSVEPAVSGELHLTN